MNIKSHWVQLIASNLHAYRRNAYDSNYIDWKNVLHVNIAAQEQLTYGIEVSCGDGSVEYSQLYYQHTIDIANRVLDNKMLTTTRRFKPFYPLNHGLLVRASQYARILSGHAVFNSQTIHHAAKSIIEWFENSPDPNLWEEISQYEYLASIIMLLIDGQFEEAQKLVDYQWDCPKHKRLQKCLIAITKSLCDGTPLKPAVAKAYQACLDKYRNPYKAMIVESFELHLLQSRIDPSLPLLDGMDAIRRMSR